MRKWGWLPDTPDFNDFKFCAIARKLSLSASSSDLRNIFPTIRDQGNHSSCTGFGTTDILMFLEMKNGKPFINLSAMFAWWNARYIEKSNTQDLGAMIRDVMKGLADWGVCPEELWPYSDDNTIVQPAPKCYEFGKDHRIVTYHRLDNPIDDVRSCLSEGYPVVFGFTVYSEVWDKCGDIGILQLPQPGDHRAGAHCVTIYGHDDSEHMFTVKNQYGPGWGDKGYFLMNYGYVESRDLSDDFWTVRIAQ